LETFGSIERIAETKWELMDSLPSDGTGVVPWGDPHLERLVRSFKKKIIYFGDAPSCPVRASAVEVGENTRFMLHLASQNARVTLKIPGRHNVMNALAAAAAGWSLGCKMEKIVHGLENFEPPKMRMQILPHPSGAILINDAYNANPASMLTAIRSLAETYPDQKRVLVLGSMLELGSETEKYHFHVGVELAHFSLEHVFLVGPEMKAVLEGAVSAGAPKNKFSLYPSAEAIGGELKKYTQRGTAILFKGSRGVHLEKAVEAA
jgi:UDP-N-acetylmuramoyl-tripeptide--D-alanyl-D-alanine ligase